ncbi:hypothetical protein [Patulibacter defluvii]|uniref:hypothetical protein n=1 Tax=Patulibacter defluvii TaxID=3095358 RepID=UPI002A74B710|nr:hypothetical protein [Patulibacter sp. DM4]
MPTALLTATIELGAQRPGDGQIPLAPVLHADHTAALVMVIAAFAGVAAALVWALVKLVRGGETLPLVLLAAGVVAANMEPLGDHVGLIVYAPDVPWFDYWLMGRQMPSFIAVGEASYIAFGGYYAYRMLANGRSVGRVVLISAVLVGIPEILVEVGWHHWGIISYYGDNPTRILGVPLYSIVQNSTLLPVLGLVAFLGAEHLRGVQRLWLLIAVPAVTIGYIVGVSWPVYVAIQSSAAAPIVWAAALVTCAASIGGAWAAINYPAVRRLREAAAAGPAPATNPTTATAAA